MVLTNRLNFIIIVRNFYGEAMIIIVTHYMCCLKIGNMEELIFQTSIIQQQTSPRNAHELPLFYSTKNTLLSLLCALAIIISFIFAWKSFSGV